MNGPFADADTDREEAAPRREWIRDHLSREPAFVMPSVFITPGTCFWLLARYLGNKPL